MEYISAQINKSFRTKLKVYAILKNITLEKAFADALEELFDKYGGVIDGTDTEVPLPLIASTQRVNINFSVEEESLEKLDKLATKTGLKRNVYINVAIKLLLTENDLD
jgi:hypothetical protein